ncbi:MAG: type I 3-dehydroquinate dehydratase [Solobacterium sp.]|nr:type I 3-dehydroquinate dehydratase [Solobacterium sp.]
MKTLRIRNLVLSEGMPKICVPLTGSTEQSVLDEAEEIRLHPADLVEWRMDFLEDINDYTKVRNSLQNLRRILGSMPILATFRTADEGGNRQINGHAYKELLNGISKEKLADLIDVEILRNAETVKDIIDTAHQNGVYVIGSYHNFQMTPSAAETRLLFQQMHDMKCDILKLAVMPNDNADVLRLLQMTDEASKLYAEPLITMSMSQTGSISRITGEQFGSCITFGSLHHSSAPGQIDVDTLHQLLKTIHTMKKTA